MENKKSLLIIFTLIISLHIFLFANLKIEEKIALTKSNNIENISKINIKNISIKKPEPTSQTAVKKIIETPSNLVKSLPKTKSKNIIKQKKKYHKKIVKKKISENIIKPIKRVQKVEKAEIQRKEQATLKSIKNKEFLNSSQIQALENEYLLKLRYLLEKNKVYPKNAKRLNQTGKVHISFVISKDGHIKNARILKNSKFKRLNNAAIKILSKINKFEPIPKKLNKNSWEITVPIIYEITRS